MKPCRVGSSFRAYFGGGIGKVEKGGCLVGRPYFRVWTAFFPVPRLR